MSEHIEPALTEWRPVPGYEGLYEVSARGEIRRLGVPDSIGRPRFGRVLRQSEDGRGYLVVSLSRNARASVVRVHRIVAAAFLGPCPEGLVVNHIDGSKQNNTAQNLEYVTGAENSRHSAAHGLHARGTRHGMAVIVPEIAAKIRRLYAEGQNSRQIARLYGLHPDHILKIVRGRHWAA